MKGILLLVWILLTIIFTLANGLLLPTLFSVFNVESGAATALVVVMWVLSAFTGAVAAAIFVGLGAFFISFFGFGRSSK